MTSEYKITRADLTASASQNRDEWRLTTWPDGSTCEKHYVDGQYVGEWRNGTPSKPAQAASAHTPTFSSEEMYEAYDMGLVKGKSETAAERDRLKDIAADRLVRLFKAERERDQARAEVKTLLAACKGLRQWTTRIQAPVSPKLRNDLAADIDAADEAIASVESEQAK